ncbi:StAR-related lipid transfer protein [Plasmodium gonderi]|uniref:StAR-related lipid transfer protein n=1 Tax=Plasmodium gonderi TaxID=77519 RepID=A0A1Y1JEF4_PLAGO|nr:StAR-related lipid transfer protein [Plasmodium gonderi]GAW79132.1 StAR-related lipid transfer protein [Plasmodium gonderi]
MILKKNRILVFSFVLAIVEYICTGGINKWTNFMSGQNRNAGKTQYMNEQIAESFIEKYFSHFSHFVQFTQIYENVRRKQNGEKNDISNVVDSQPMQTFKFRMLGRNLQEGEVNVESNVKENPMEDTNITGNSDSGVNNEESEESKYVNGQSESETILQNAKSNIDDPIKQKTVIVKPSPLIEDETVKHYLNVCTEIRTKTFPYNNCQIFHNSTEVTLYKNLLEDKRETRYDLIGYGTLQDVSLYGLSRALNNIDIIKKWNKNIYTINYLKLNKESIIEKYQNDEKIDPTKFIIKNENDNPRGNRRYIYLVNGLPWPFRSHDTVYEFYQKYIEDQNMLLVANRSISGTFKDNYSYTRIQNYENFFCLYPKSSNPYEKGLDYVISVYYDVNIPTFIRNNILSQIFPSLIFNLHESSKKITEEGLSMTSEEMKKNELPFELKENNSSDTSIETQNSKDLQEEDSPSFGFKVIRVIFIDPFYFIWTANVNFFKKIYVIITSIF